MCSSKECTCEMKCDSCSCKSNVAFSYSCSVKDTPAATREGSAVTTRIYSITETVVDSENGVRSDNHFGDYYIHERFKQVGGRAEFAGVRIYRTEYAEHVVSGVDIDNLKNETIKEALETCPWIAPEMWYAVYRIFDKHGPDGIQSDTSKTMNASNCFCVDNDMAAFAESFPLYHTSNTTGTSNKPDSTWVIDVPEDVIGFVRHRLMLSPEQLASPMIESHISEINKALVKLPKYQPALNFAQSSSMRYYYIQLVGGDVNTPYAIVKNKKYDWSAVIRYVDEPITSCGAGSQCKVESYSNYAFNTTNPAAQFVRYLFKNQPSGYNRTIRNLFGFGTDSWAVGVVCCKAIDQSIDALIRSIAEDAFAIADICASTIPRTAIVYQAVEHMKSVLLTKHGMNVEFDILTDNNTKSIVVVAHNKCRADCCHFDGCTVKRDWK